MNPKFKNISIAMVCLFMASRASSQTSLLKMEPINFSQVNITDSFWKPKIDKVATQTLAACIYQTETATPRLRNFEKVARKKGENVTQVKNAS